MPCLSYADLMSVRAGLGTSYVLSPVVPVGLLTGVFVFQGVVTAATSLITTLAQKNPEEFKTSVSLAVSRLSRVSPCVGTDIRADLIFIA